MSSGTPDGLFEIRLLSDGDDTDEETRTDQLRANQTKLNQNFNLLQLRYQALLDMVKTLQGGN